MVSPEADDDEKLIDGESRKTEPFTDKCVDGVEVPIPKNPDLVNLNLSVRIGAEAAKLSFSVPKDKSPSGVEEA